MVANELIWARISVADGDAERQIQMQVGAATPSCSLIDALIVQFSLKGNEWSLWCNDQEMDPYDIIADFDCAPQKMLSLTLKKAVK